MKLTEFEALVLTGVIAGGTDADTVSIFEEVEQLLPAKKELSLGKLYVTLDHLEQSGLVQSRYSHSQDEPNGRSRRYFETTGAGSRVLKEFLANSALPSSPRPAPAVGQP
jgi:PadR family transcriptional regulator, regulatory protein PadR